ncbi:MAG: carboxypeptidase regulatory-like domain-containing protein [Bryobacteraceae bacterium]
MKPSRVTLLALVFIGWVPPLEAQATLGAAAVAGTVRDEQKLRVPGARILLTEKLKNLVREAVSDDSGEFLFPSVTAGGYKMEVSKAGFTTTAMDDLHVEIGGRLVLEVSLHLGETRTEIVVSGAATILDTETNVVGTVVDSGRIANLPLNGRNFLQLGLLAGGVTETSSFSASFTINVGPPGRVVVLPGSMPSSVNYSLNGIPIRSSRDGELALSPSVAALDQFKVETGFLPPDRGPNAGVVNIVTKSGSNSLHGELFEFFRNRRLDARSFFASAPEDLKRNQFGIAAGGPVLKNKIWFHGFYEGLREATAFSRFGYSPTAAMFAGRFAETERTIYDPATYSPASGTRTPFPDNVIPSGQINPVARRLAEYYLPGSSLSSRPGNVLRSPLNTFDDNQGGLRIDAAISDRQQLFGQLFKQDSPADRQNLYPLSGLLYKNSADLAMLQHTWTIGPRAVSVFRAGFLRNVAVGGNEAQDGGPILKSIGIGNTFDNRGVSTINLLGYTPFGRSNGDVGNRDQAWHLAGELNYSRTGHTIKLGTSASFRRGWHTNANANAHGVLSFEPVYSAQLARNAAGQLLPQNNSGDAWADFLLGTPTIGVLGGLPEARHSGTKAFPFIQDTWKVTPNITLNYGISWNLETPPDPRGWARDLVHGFDKASGLLTFAALGQLPPRAVAIDLNNWAPRLGIAWKPGFLGSTVVRAGAGVYYSEFPLIISQFPLAFGSPIGTGQGFTNPRTNPVPVYSLGANVFPSLTYPPLDLNYAASLPAGTIISALDPGMRTAYASQWNVSLQQGWGRNNSMELVYLGSSAHQLANYLDFGQCRPSGNLLCNPASKPWPRYGAVIGIDSSGNSSYHALMAKYQLRTERGLNLRIEYTWSKALADTWQSNAEPNSQITVCRRCEKGPASFDVRHRAVASAVWELPFGRGRARASNVSRAADLLIGGWGISGIATIATGQPVILRGPNRTGSPVIIHLPDRVCDGRNSDISGNVRNNGFLWFETACFSTPPVGYFGNSGRTVLNAPGLNNWDIGVQKSFVPHERSSARLILRGEAFNALNHTQFSSPNGDLSAGINFGRITSTRAPRLIQISAKIVW